ncbi:MAG: hypothetical protein JSW03_07085 [Candidatus Eiseniibacteriota bacterium]|nr:MAG: hypothetical protein JSW03_07085 [Candidatus Eisenbacteria bacterium]
MTPFLRYAVFLSSGFCLVSLLILLIKTFAFGRRTNYAKHRGSAVRGVLYAFGRGMMPTEKESARRHLFTYSAGVTYHGGILAALVYLVLLLLEYELPAPLLSLFRLLLTLGFVAGFFLLLRRILLPAPRKLSCPDDFAANILVTAFVLLGAVHSQWESGLPLFFLTATAVFLYVPLGKIRHCVFFFYSRVLFGLFYGSRGVLPQEKKQEAA